MQVRIVSAIGMVLILGMGLLSREPSSLYAPVAAAGSVPIYPPAFYPFPIPLKRGVIWDMSQGCPNPAGLRQQERLARATVDRLFAQLTSGRLPVMRQASDRALWPNLNTGARRDTLRVSLSPAQPASRSPYAGIINNGCGRDTLRLSWYVMMCPSQCRQALIHSRALIGYLYLVNRRGRWLAWAEE